MRSIVSRLLWVCLVVVSGLSAQVNNEVRHKTVFELADSAWELRKTDPDMSRALAVEMLNEAKRIDFEEGVSLAYRRLSTAHKYLGNSDSALLFIDSSLFMEIAADRPFRLGNVYLNKGRLLQSLSRFIDAISNYQRAVETFEICDSIEYVAKAYSSIGEVHETINDTTAARTNYLKSLKLRKALGNPINLSRSMLNLGIYYSKTGAFKKAKFFVRSYKEVHLRLGIKASAYNVGKANGVLGNICFDMGQLDSAAIYFALDIRSPHGVNSIELKHNLGVLLVSLERPDSALSYLRRSASMASEVGNRRLLATCWENMGSAFELKGDFETALDFERKSRILSDSLLSLSVRTQVKEIQEKYDNQKLTSEKLQAQQAQKEEETKNQRLMIAAISLGALLVIAILITTLYKQRLTAKNQMAIKDQEIHRKQLDELVKEKELERVTSLMEGQEKERARIARELHDGLGSLLATVKHHYQTVEDKMDQGQDQFESANRLLDDACVEVRRISHDMASNVLSKFGLIAALQDYVETIASSGAIKLELKVSGVNDRLENSKEIHLFRIVQELVSNVLKHAEATSATIHFTAHQDSLNVLVEDNGKGFDTKEMGQRDGMGMANLGARVAHLEGTLDIDSSLGKGTTVIIEVPTQQNV